MGEVVMNIPNMFDKHEKHLEVAKEHISACIKNNLTPQHVANQVQDIYNITLPAIDTWQEVLGLICAAQLRVEKLNKQIKEKQKSQKKILEIRGQMKQQKPVKPTSMRKQKKFKPYKPRYDGINAI